MLTEALLKYLRLPTTIADSDRVSEYGIASLPAKFTAIRSPLPLFAIQLVVEDEATGRESYELLKSLPIARPNVRLLEFRVERKWTAKAVHKSTTDMEVDTTTDAAGAAAAASSTSASLSVVSASATVDSGTSRPLP